MPILLSTIVDPNYFRAQQAVKSKMWQHPFPEAYLEQHLKTGISATPGKGYLIYESYTLCASRDESSS